MFIIENVVVARLPSHSRILEYSYRTKFVAEALLTKVRHVLELMYSRAAVIALTFRAPEITFLSFLSVI